MTALTGFVDDRRVVLEMTGADTRSILQDVITNDISSVGENAIVYAALLTPQGKYLFDFFVLDDGAADRILIDIARDRASAFAQRLGMYCLRRDAKVSRVTPLQVALLWGDGSPDTTGLRCHRDPRLDAMGWRIYAEDAGSALSRLGASAAERSDFDILRIRHMVPETGIELMPDETYILEAGFERLNGVDFRKGCYVGQEVTARMKHKTELRKGLVRVRVDGETTPGTAITANGKPAGTLFSALNGEGLAHLRLDRAGPDMAAGSAKVDYPL